MSGTLNSELDWFHSEFQVRYRATCYFSNESGAFRIF